MTTRPSSRRRSAPVHRLLACAALLLAAAPRAAHAEDG
jgi:hypothetical protein